MKISINITIWLKEMRNLVKNSFEISLKTYTIFLVSKCFTQISLFQRREETAGWPEICLHSQTETFATSCFISHSFFFVQASLNGGKLQRNFFTFSKTSRWFSKQFAERGKGKTNLGDLHGIYHRKRSWRACYFKSAFKLSAKINKQNKSMKQNNTCTLRTAAKAET